MDNSFAHFFLKRVASSDPDSCWIWNGYINPSHGYGECSIGKRGEVVRWRAHRLSYVLYKGPLRDDLQIDHLCRVRSCVNPAHLELVTARTNTLRGFGLTAMNARKTHCPQGHPLFGENLIIHAGQRRGCRACRRIAEHKRAARKEISV